MILARPRAGKLAMVSLERILETMPMDGTCPFRPYIKTLPIRNCPVRFFYATPEAQEWYDPLKPYALLEYEWVVANLDLKNQRIVDAGSHHGQYAVLFGLASQGTSEIVAVDPIESNCAIIEANLALNGVKASIVQCVVADRAGTMRFSGDSNGHIVAEGGIELPSRRLPDVMKDPTVVKLDIEGAEFYVLPSCIDEMKSVHTWIIEVHPTAKRDPAKLISLLCERNFELHWVNRQKNCVELYPASAHWSTHTTIFARRQQ